MKKNLVIIALIAMFLLGLSALQAVPFQIVVHVVSIGPASGGYQITGSPPVYRSWGTGGDFPMTLNGNLGSEFSCWGSSQYGSDSDGGVLNPYVINHFYLDLTGVEPVPDPPPNND